MWLLLRNLYTGVKAQILYSGSLSRKFNILQGTGQGRIPAPFMYKVYINGILNELTQHSCALSLYSIRLATGLFPKSPQHCEKSICRTQAKEVGK